MMFAWTIQISLRLSHQRHLGTLALRTTEELLALSLKNVLPLFDAIEAVQLTALRYTITAIRAVPLLI
jgi:hypothetical protein